MTQEVDWHSTQVTMDHGDPSRLPMVKAECLRCKRALEHVHIRDEIADAVPDMVFSCHGKSVTHKVPMEVVEDGVVVGVFGLFRPTDLKFMLDKPANPGSFRYVVKHETYPWPWCAECEKHADAVNILSSAKGHIIGVEIQCHHMCELIKTGNKEALRSGMAFKEIAPKENRSLPEIDWPSWAKRLRGRGSGGNDGHESGTEHQKAHN